MKFDFVILGAGPSGCALAYRLQQLRPNLQIGVVDTDPDGSEAAPGQSWTSLLPIFGAASFASTPQIHAGERQVHLGVAPGSVQTSPLWCIGRQDDFDHWRVPGWAWSDVERAFNTVNRLVCPTPQSGPDDLSIAFSQSFDGLGTASPTPEAESAGLFRVVAHGAASRSARETFLTPALATGKVHLHQGAAVDRIELFEGRAQGVILEDGTKIAARAGVVIAAGAILSPAILLRSGIGPAEQAQALGRAVCVDAPCVGADLHDHPTIAVQHEVETSPLGSLEGWLGFGRSPKAKCRVEAGAFFRASGKDGGDGRPDCQVHFVPNVVGFGGPSAKAGQGYGAQVHVARPMSRGAVTLASLVPSQAPVVDLGLFNDDRDLDLLTQGLQRLRRLMGQALGEAAAPEVQPGPDLRVFDELKSYVRDHAGVAQNPVGSLRMGQDAPAPVSPELEVKGVDGLWVADASIMPTITSAGTLAASMMIGYHAARFISRAR